MTLKQMEYALTIAKCASLSEASKLLFIAQPSLTEAMKKLEAELGFDIFIRERTGVSVTPEGEEFLNAAQSVMDQVANIQRQSERRNKEVVKLSISAIHYFFMGEVFAQVINAIEAQGRNSYEVKLLDAGTLEVINHVVDSTSELGIISYTEHSKSYVMRELRKLSLECYEIMSTRLFAFMRGGHPLLRKQSITMKDLEPYPYVSIWQNESSMYYFTEEGIFMPANQKKIYIQDGGTMRALLRETDAFAMGSGVIPSDVSPLETQAVEVIDAPITTICWIKRTGHELSSEAKEFLKNCNLKLGREITI